MILLDKLKKLKNKQSNFIINQIITVSKMKWNITSVKITDNNQHVDIEGYSLDDDITYFSSTVKYRS